MSRTTFLLPYSTLNNPPVIHGKVSVLPAVSNADRSAGYQATFKRYELKYLLTRQQKQALLQAMEPFMKLDHYGRTTIRNIYLDTENFRLIRRSLEKPVYKEKLRIRSYSRVDKEDPVFIELKKKYQSVVYKRRLTLPEGQTMTCFREQLPIPVCSQIADEIQYFRDHYAPLCPSVFLSYEREAYFSKDEGDFRITFDENILYRREGLSLRSGIYGIPLLKNGNTLLEIKTSGAIPLWMCHAAGCLHLFRTSFSKYGAAYVDIVKTEKKGDYIL